RETKSEANPIPSARPGVSWEMARISSFSGAERKNRAISSAVGNGSAVESFRTAIATSRKTTAFKYLKTMIARNPPESFPLSCIAATAGAIVSVFLLRDLIVRLHGRSWMVKPALAFLLAAAAAAAEQPVLVYRPAHEELKYTFGGAAPARRIKPGTRIVSWTEDCYDGAVTKPGQLPSKVQLPGHDNPQTGPFFVEGAEPGDTLAIHLEKLEPARDYGISSSFPGFGALNGTDRTAILGADLPETVWFYQVDRA